MISLSKSKEYAKLANQVPIVFNIEKGNKILNNNDLKRAGIKVLNTKQEKYLQNIADIKGSADRYSLNLLKKSNF